LIPSLPPFCHQNTTVVKGEMELLWSIDHCLGRYLHLPMEHPIKKCKIYYFGGQIIIRYKKKWFQDQLDVIMLFKYKLV
jgi:hypothetical protein